MNDKKHAVTTIEDAATYMAVPTETIRDLMDSGELPTTRIGAFIRCRYSDLDAFLRKKTTRNQKLQDTELRDEMLSLVRVWTRTWGSKPVRPTELNDLCNRENLLLARRGDMSERSQVIRLGRLLGAIKGADFDGLSVMSVTGRQGKLYCLESNANSASTSRSQSETIPTDSESDTRSEAEKTSC